MSANADYGVSIVESFAPPENWLPGQEVNKDVYAVNTGNVEAFVEETVSGVLTITTEEAYVTENNKPDADSIELTAAERYVIEDGSYLAYKPATSNLELGNKVVAMNPDFDDQTAYTSAEGDFTPDAEGLYVFRRYIGVDPTTHLETFKYDAYYCVPGTPTIPATPGSEESTDPETGITTPAVSPTEEVPGIPAKYYKVSNLSVVPDNLYYAGDEVNTDGNLESATCGFYKEKTVTVTPNLKYEDADDDHGKRLVATYNGVKSSDEAMETLAGFAEDYDDALIAYQDALNEYAAALRDAKDKDGDAADENAALQEAINTLLEKQSDLKDKQDALDAAIKDRDAKERIKNAAQAAKEAAEAEQTAAQAALQTASNNYSDAHDATATAQEDVNTAQEDVNTAQGDVDGYDNVTAKSAFEDYCEDEGIDLDTVTYEDLSNAGITNDNVGYEYYEKLVELLRTKKVLAEKQAILAQKQAEEAEASQRNTDAQTRFANAQADVTAKTTAYNTALQNYNDAVADVEAKETARDDAITARDDAQDAVNEAQAAYNAAKADADNANGDVDAAALELAKAQLAMDAAEAAYNSAYAAANGQLKIYINLSDDVTKETGTADKWQLLPANDPSNELGETAYFYYTSILGGGETSTKLIDSVELDKDTTEDMFKRFDFDLNVALKSAQIAKDADGKITTDATTELDANATLETPTSVDSVVNWTLK